MVNGHGSLLVAPNIEMRQILTMNVGESIYQKLKFLRTFPLIKIKI